jgi:enoyl-CoA hydratase/carnithine racemase
MMTHTIVLSKSKNRLVGPQQAARMMLTGELLSAQEAKDLGLVLDVVEDAEDVVPKAVELASKIARGTSPLAVQLTTETIRRLVDHNGAGLAQALAREADAQALCYAGSDLVRGLEAVRRKETIRYDD